LDSIVCSLLLAFLRHREALACHDLATFFPVINIPKDDLKLRSESVWALARQGIDEEMLIFRDQVDFEKLRYSSNYCFELSLVDHNRLANSQTSLGPVVEIIDHHINENLYEDTVVHREVQTVGSCATLVALEYKKSPLTDALDAGLAELLCSTILIDTGNFSEKAKRYTDLDLTVFEELEKCCEIDRNQLYKTLQQKKFDVSCLCTYDLLRKDYKEFSYPRADGTCLNIGMSSVTQSFECWCENSNEGISEEIHRWCEERSLDALIIMTAFVEKGEFTRQIGIIKEADSDSQLCELGSYLQSLDNLQLQQCAKIDNQVLCFHPYSLDPLISRKVLQPILMKYFQPTKQAL